ncbi:MAG TPA: transposase [Casimicrobiaceae bacterium]|nr:transposase [Casimicrobiaceae bacterium]
MKMMDTKKAGLASDGVRVNRTGRRTYTAAYKLDVVRRCSDPGVSVAAVAMAHGINANLVRRWIVRHQRASSNATPTVEAALLPVTIEASASGARRSDDQAKPPARRHHPAGSIEIELHGARIHLHGGVDVSALTAVIDVLSRR